jgi:hypothetical protein
MNTHSATSHSIHPFLLWFGILACPFAWSAQELVSYMFASSRCLLRAASPAEQQVFALSAPFVWVSVLTWVITIAGCVVAIRNWRKLRVIPRGSQLDLTIIVPERQHFMAKCGLINSTLFTVAFLFTTADLLVAPLCGK